MEVEGEEEEVSMTPPEEDSRGDNFQQGEEELGMNLPEDLVARILAMVPFPFIFKARILSKSWLARFASIASQDGELKSLASSFQKQVGEWSTSTWKSFCPVFVGKGEYLMYHQASRTWQRIPLLSFLPEDLLTRFRRSKLQTAGALLFISTSPEIRDDFYQEFRRSTRLRDIRRGKYTLYVANMLTRSWKQLPPRPPADSVDLDDKLHYLDAKLVTHKASETYKVIAFYVDVGYCLAQIYDSKASRWSSNRLYDSENLVFLSHCAYLNGVLYRVVRNNEVGGSLLAFSVEEGTFQVFEMPPIDIELQFGLIDLVVCKGNLLMVAYNHFLYVENVVVLKIDLVSRRWLEVTRGPPAALNFGNLEKHPASDGDCIFFASAKFVGDIMLAYNLHEDVWSCFPCPTVVNQLDAPHPLFAPALEYKWTVSTFQPGLNPFLGV
ncbi:unnamed protein product [Calypogeia fissa]